MLKRRSCTSHAAFTLVELVVAMSVAAVVWAVVVLVVDSLTHPPTKLSHAARMREEGRTVLQKMSRELAMAKHIVQIVDRNHPTQFYPMEQSITFVAPEGLSGVPAIEGDSCGVDGPLVPNPNAPPACVSPPPDGLTQYLRLMQYKWKQIIGVDNPLKFKFVVDGPSPNAPNSDYSTQLHEILPHCRLRIMYVLDVDYRTQQGADWVSVSRRVFSGDPEILSGATLRTDRWLDQLFDDAVLETPPVRDLVVRLRSIHLALTVFGDDQQVTVHETVRCALTPHVTRYWDRSPPT